MDMHAWIFAAWLMAGLLLGAGHAATLWISVRPRSLSWLPLTGLLRMAVLGGVLAGAVLGGGILPAGAGWAVGFAAVATTILLQRAR